MTEIAELGFLPLTGDDARLQWASHEGEGNMGYEVSEIPKTGMVYFSDADGPVHRQENIDDARWWVFGRTNTARVRITRLESAGVFTYIVPGVIPAIVCDHGCKEPGQCAVVATLALQMVNA